MPERAPLTRACLLIAIFCVISTFGLFILSPEFLAPQADEYHSIWPAKRLLEGAVPYVDVFTHRPPVDVLTNASVLAVFGESLSASRIYQVLCWVASGYLLFFLFLRWGARDLVAAALALAPIALCFAFWPVPSSHWQALPLALGAVLLLEATPKPTEEGASRARLVGAGFLAGLAGLTIQTEGVVICAWLVLRAVGRGGPRREVPWLVLGIASTLLLATLGLLAVGGLGAALRCTVYFPLFHYKQGFNDVSFFEGLQATASFVRGAYGVSALGLMAAGGLLGLAAPVLVLVRAFQTREAKPIARALWTLVHLVVLFKARPDWVHVTFYLPYLLLPACEVLLREDPPRALRCGGLAWLGGTWVLGGWLFLASWSGGVRPTQALDLDLERRALLQQTLLTLPPELREGPLLSLPYGSSVYFFREAEAPRIDWVCLPSQGYNPPEDLEYLARWLREREVAVVLLANTPEGTGFLREASPLQEALSGYEVYREAGGRIILVRRDLYERYGMSRFRQR